MDLHERLLVIHDGLLRCAISEAQNAKYCNNLAYQMSKDGNEDWQVETNYAYALTSRAANRFACECLMHLIDRPVCPDCGKEPQLIWLEQTVEPTPRIGQVWQCSCGTRFTRMVDSCPLTLN